MSKVKYFKGFWTVNDVRQRQHCLFIYGDNDIHRGRGGQAIIRDLRNTEGIPTKKYPNNNISSFYTDAEYEKNKQKINAAIQNIYIRSRHYKYVVFPINGIGTGLADLNKKAPKTYKYLKYKLNLLKSSI